MRSRSSIRRFYVLFFLHFFLINPLPAQTSRPGILQIDKHKQSAIIDSISTSINDVYVFPDVAKQMEQHIRTNLTSGSYSDITDLNDFTRRLTADMQSISKDRHLAVQPLPSTTQGNLPELSKEEIEKLRIASLKKKNFGFEKVEILPGNIGYLKFNQFTSADLAGGTAMAAMNFLAYSDALIFDLRQNGGGSPSLIQFITSYLFEEPVHLNSFYIRKSDETRQFWTQAHVEGPKMTKVPVYVLTSGYTFSGAEEFSYNLKHLKRGRLVGETTGGGAHPTETHEFRTLGIVLHVPYGRAINPVTGTNWEGTGVEPDIKVPAEQALMTARLEILQQLIENERDEQKSFRLSWLLETLKAQNDAVVFSEEQLKDYEGTFGPRTFWVENGNLVYQRENRPKFIMIPMGNDRFMIEGLDYFRILFKRDESGRVIELTGQYDNGDTDSQKKN